MLIWQARRTFTPRWARSPAAPLLAFLCITVNNGALAAAPAPQADGATKPGPKPAADATRTKPQANAPKPSDAARRAAPLPSWKPDAPLIGFLGSPVPLGDAGSGAARYQLQVPEGYRLEPGAGRRDATFQEADPSALRWVGQTRPDGTQPYLVVLLTSLRVPGLLSASPLQRVSAGQITPQIALEAILLRLHPRVSAASPSHDGVDTWLQTPVERGLIGNIPFVRARWKAQGKPLSLPELLFRRKDAPEPKWVYGFVYVARDGDTLITLSAECIEPHHIQTLPLVEAAVLTFKQAISDPTTK